MIRIADLAIAGDVLDWPAVPCCPSLSRQMSGLPSVSAGICRAAVLWDSPNQLTLSQSSLAFRLPARCSGTLVPLPDVVLRLPVGTAACFFLLAIGSFNSLRMGSETCKVEIAFINGNSSCFSMILRQGQSEKSFFPSSVWLR